MALISSKSLGTLVRIADSDGGSGTANYEIADINNFVPGGVVLVRKNIYSNSAFGSTTHYPDSTLDNLIRTTIYNEMPQQLRDKMMDVSFKLSDSGDIIRKMFALTYTMMGFNTDKAPLQLYTSDARRVKRFDGSVASWWLSSNVTALGTSSSRYVVSDGTASYSDPSKSRGVVPAFAIPQSLQIEDSANTDGSYNLKLAEKIACTINMGSTAEMPKSALPIINCNGNPTLQICNNANDAAPAWEAATNETVHTFANAAKTADQWAIGLNIDITRTAGESLFLNEPVVLAMK